MKTAIIVTAQEADHMISGTPPLFRIRRSDGRWFAGYDARGHALFRRKELEASEGLKGWAERQAHLLRCYGHEVELRVSREG